MQPKDSPFTPEVGLTLGGVAYTLCFPLPAIFVFEDLTGLKILSEGFNPADYQKLDLRAKVNFVAQACVAGMSTHHPEMTVERVLAHLYPYNFEEAGARALEALAAALPKAVPQEDGEAAAGPLAEAPEAPPPAS